MAWFQDIVRGLGTQNAPFGFGPDVSPSQGAVDPAYNAGMQMIGNVGMGMLASGEKNPMRALGRSYLVAQNNAQEQNKQQFLAAQMLQAADEKKKERQAEQDKKDEFEKYVQTLPPDQQPLARMFPDKFGAAVIGQKFPDPQGSGGSSNWGMSVVPVRNKKTGELAAGQFNQGSGGIFVNGQPADPNEWAFDPGYLSQEKASGAAEGKVIGGAKGILSSEKANADFVKGKIDDVINDPALESGIGWASYLPDGMASNKLIGFRTKLAEINSQAFLQARTMLRGGGAITDFESRKAEEAYSAAQIAIRSGDPQTLKDALGRFKEAIDAGMAKLEAQAGGGSAPAPAGTTEDPLGLR